MSPSCCERSTTNRTVTLFVPAAQSSLPHWVATFRDEDDRIVANGVVPVSFCPFCGTRLGREHLPFEGAQTKEPVR